MGDREGRGKEEGVKGEWGKMRGQRVKRGVWWWEKGETRENLRKWEKEEKDDEEELGGGKG